MSKDLETSPEETDEVTLDLGLGDLLEVESEKTPVSEPEPSSVEAKEPVEKETQLQVTLNRYQQLAADENWGQLASICEKEIADKGDSYLEAQLWWLKVQLVTGDVPANILSAPLESASRMVEELLSSAKEQTDQEYVDGLKLLASEVIIEAAAKIQESSERLTVLILLHRALDFAPDSCGSVRPVFENLKTGVDLEKPQSKLESQRRAEENSELYDQLASLEKRLRSESSGLSSSKSSVTASSSPVTPENHDADTGEHFLGEIFRNKDRFSLRTRYRVITGLVILLLFSSLWVSFSASAGSRAETVGMVLLGELPRAQLQAPDPGVLSRLSNLDAIFYGIGSVEPEATKVEPVPAARQVASKQPPRAEPKQPVEVVDTKGPVEPANIRDMRDRASRGNQDVRVAAIDRGSAAFGHEVQRLPPNTHYRISRSTSIMTTPSLFAGSIAELNTGDTVLVESRIGNWLRLRSKSGEAGYIHIGDADRL